MGGRIRGPTRVIEEANYVRVRERIGGCSCGGGGGGGRRRG